MGRTTNRGNAQSEFDSNQAFLFISFPSRYLPLPPDSPESLRMFSLVCGITLSSSYISQEPGGQWDKSNEGGRQAGNVRIVIVRLAAQIACKHDLHFGDVSASSVTQEFLRRSPSCDSFHHIVFIPSACLAQPT